MEGDVFRMKKESAVIGTCEAGAFILSLRDSNEFSKTHSSGYHCIPHIGVYGENYTVCAPIALISLPPTPSCLQALPSDLKGALDLNPLLEHSESCRTTDPTGGQTGRTGTTKRKEALEEEEELSNEADRHPLKPMWTVGRFDTLKEENGEKEEEGGGGQEPREGIDSCGSGCGSFSIVVQDFDKGDLNALRRLAQNIVMNALRQACKILETSARSSSVLYLTANSKRLKVRRSPSPLKEAQEEEEEVSSSPSPMENHVIPPWTLDHQTMAAARLDTSCICDSHSVCGACPADRASSPSVDRYRKRSRSHSQDAHAMSELDAFRMQKGITGARVQSGELGEEMPFDAHFNVLNGVTLFVNNVGDCPLGLGTSSLYLGLENNGLGLGTNRSQHGLGTIVNSLEKMSITEPWSDSIPTAGGSHRSMEDGQVQQVKKRANYWNCLGDSCCLPGIDLFVIIHTYPPPSVCQKFLCDKENEVNLMYHFWLFPCAPLDDNFVRQEVLEMGVFEPHGVAPVHQDLKDGGVAFHYVEGRTVCIHHCSLSPENAQLELQKGYQLHTFFSAARCGTNRTVITYHVVPGSYSVEQQLRDAVGSCSTLSELVEGLLKNFREPANTIYTLISSLLR